VGSEGPAVPPSQRTPFDEVNLAQAYAELQTLLLESADVTDFLQELATLSAAVVPATACGITLRGERDAFTVASSDQLARDVDEIQYGRRQGPCLHAMNSGERVLITNLAEDDRWPEYRIRAAKRAIASSLSLPLNVAAQTVGALNLYGTRPDQFDAESIRRAEAFSGQSATALTIMLRHASQLTLAEQLREALESRAVIDQAIGVIVAQQRCSATDAFGVLRRGSQHRNVKLSVVAAELIEAASGHPPQPPRPFTQRG
jgi:GAF domain-containing protein